MWGQNWNNWKEKGTNLLSQLETSAPRNQKWLHLGEAENQEGHIWAQQHYQSAGYNYYPQTSSTNCSKMSFFLKLTETFTKIDHILGHEIC